MRQNVLLTALLIYCALLLTSALHLPNLPTPVRQLGRLADSALLGWMGWRPGIVLFPMQREPLNTFYASVSLEVVGKTISGDVVSLKRDKRPHPWPDNLLSSPSDVLHYRLNRKIEVLEQKASRRRRKRANNFRATLGFFYCHQAGGSDLETVSLAWSGQFMLYGVKGSEKYFIHIFRWDCRRHRIAGEPLIGKFHPTDENFLRAWPELGGLHVN